MENEIKCVQREKTKSGFHRGKQRYKCKSCGGNYTRGQRGYPDYVKLQVINYLAGNGFRRIKRLMHVSRLSVINWVKQLVFKIESIPRKNQKVDVLELGEVCINLKKI